MKRERPLRDGLYLDFVDPETGAPRLRPVLPTLGSSSGLRFGASGTGGETDEDLILFAFQSEARETGALDSPPARGEVNLVVVVDGRPIQCTLDAEQSVALGLGLLLSNPGELRKWLGDQAAPPEPIPEA